MCDCTYVRHAMNLTGVLFLLRPLTQLEMTRAKIWHVMIHRTEEIPIQTFGTDNLCGRPRRRGHHEENRCLDQVSQHPFRARLCSFPACVSLNDNSAIIPHVMSSHRLNKLDGHHTYLREFDELRAVHFTRTRLTGPEGREVQEHLAKTLHINPVSA